MQLVSFEAVQRNEPKFTTIGILKLDSLIVLHLIHKNLVHFHGSFLMDKYVLIEN